MTWLIGCDKPFTEPNGKFGFVYLITNEITGDKYFGRRILKGNWKNYYGSGKKLKPAIKEYGKENFTREILCFCDNKKDLEEAEEMLLEFFNVKERDDFYNIAINGKFDRTGMKNSDEHKRKISEKNKKYWSDEEKRQKQSEKVTGEKNPMYGVDRSGEKHPFYGKHHTEESNIKICEGNSNLTKEDVLEILKRRFILEETQKEISKDYGGLRVTITEICSGRSWKHVYSEFFEQHPHLKGKKINKSLKLSDEKVWLILDLNYRGKVKQKHLEEIFDISFQQVSAICRGKARKDIYAEFMKTFSPQLSRAVC